MHGFKQELRKTAECIEVFMECCEIKYCPATLGSFDSYCELLIRKIVV